MLRYKEKSVTNSLINTRLSRQILNSNQIIAYEDLIKSRIQINIRLRCYKFFHLNT